MKHSLRLDIQRIRRNLERVAGMPLNDDDLHRALASRGVWRRSDEWWGATAEALPAFAEGEIVERRAEPPGLGGVHAPDVR